MIKAESSAAAYLLDIDAEADSISSVATRRGLELYRLCINWNDINADATKAIRFHRLMCVAYSRSRMMDIITKDSDWIIIIYLQIGWLWCAVDDWRLVIPLLSGIFVVAAVSMAWGGQRYFDVTTRSPPLLTPRTPKEC